MAWTNQSKNIATYVKDINYLLKQSLDYLLLETGDKIVLQRSSGHKTTADWTNQSKN